MLADGSSFPLPLCAASRALRCVPEAIAADRHTPKPLREVCQQAEMKVHPTGSFQGLARVLVLLQVSHNRKDKWRSSYLLCGHPHPGWHQTPSCPSRDHSQHNPSPLVVNRQLHFSYFSEDKRRRGGHSVPTTPLCCASGAHRCTACSRSC